MRTLNNFSNYLHLADAAGGRALCASLPKSHGKPRSGCLPAGAGTGRPAAEGGRGPLDSFTVSPPKPAGARDQETHLLQEVGLGKWVGQEVQERNTLASLSSRSHLLIPPIGQAHRKPGERETQIKPRGQPQGPQELGICRLFASLPTSVFPQDSSSFYTF